MAVIIRLPLLIVFGAYYLLLLGAILAIIGMIVLVAKTVRFLFNAQRRIRLLFYHP